MHVKRLVAALAVVVALPWVCYRWSDNLTRSHEAALLKQPRLDVAYAYFRPMALACRNDRLQWQHYSVAYSDVHPSPIGLEAEFRACSAVLPAADQVSIASRVAARLDSGAGLWRADAVAAARWRALAERASRGLTPVSAYAPLR